MIDASGLFWLVMIGGIFFVLFWVLPGFFVLKPREEAVLLNWGRFVGVERSEGVKWSQPWGRRVIKVPTQDVTFEVARTTVVEANGNPIEISAVVACRVEDSRKAALDVANYLTFVRDQSTSVIKRVASHYPYDSPDPKIPCLRKESEEVSRALLKELQGAVGAAGMKIISVRINDLAYAPEIAQAMLMRQQAMAMIEARRAIVESAVEIVRDCLERLQRGGLTLSPARQEELLSNLLVVICSGERVTPTLTVATHRPHAGS